MRLNLLFYLIILIQIKFNYCFLETALIYGTVAGASYYAYTIRCKFVQCCEIKDPSNIFYNLGKNLDNQIFGQPILKKILPAAIHQHVNKRKPSNPLIISLHGWTGNGKTYSSQIVAETLFDKGLNSIYVKKITPAVFFPNPNYVHHYKEKLVKLLEDQAYLCPNSLIIIEEIDKLHPELIETLSSYLNNQHPRINHMIFIFTSNVGSDKIVQKTFEFYKTGKNREDIELHEFESIVKNQVYNDESTMKYSSLISSHLINHYIPFLPMERSHVEECINAYVREISPNRYLAPSNRERIKEVIFKSLEWWPSDLKLYSNSGCKQVANKVDIAIKILT